MNAALCTYQGALYVVIYVDGAPVDQAGPFDNHEDAAHALERCLRIGGGL